MDAHTRTEFDTALDLAVSQAAKLRLEEIKRKLNLHETDTIWLYVAALENYQRLFEATPKLIKEAAEAERKLLLADVDKIALEAEERINSAADSAEKVAQAAANRAAESLISKIDQAVTKKIAAESWKNRFIYTAALLALAAGATAVAGFLSAPTPAWVWDALPDTKNPLGRLISLVFYAPAGLAILAALAAAGIAFWVESQAKKRVW